MRVISTEVWQNLRCDKIEKLRKRRQIIAGAEKVKQGKKEREREKRKWPKLSRNIEARFYNQTKKNFTTENISCDQKCKHFQVIFVFK